MTFLQAKEKLDKLAKGKYHQIQYSISQLKTMDQCIAECTLSLSIEDKFYIGSSDNWKESFVRLERKLKKIPAIDTSEVPKMDL
jgi:hypothetical protein